MSSPKEHSLSSDDLRKRLYQTFKNRGVLDSLKTQLRNQLIHELQPPLARQTLPIAATSQDHPVSVLASNSLVVDHLQSCGYEYTLSVFYPECGMSKDKIFSTRDLLQFMKISPNSPIYRSLVSNTQNGQKGLLISLLSEFIDHHIHSELRDANTQTLAAQSSGESLVRKLQLIDEEYEDLRQKGSRWAPVEAKLAAYRKEIEEQSHAELKVKLQHFQEVELVQVRKEEQAKCRQELTELTRSLERTYEQKTGALMNREKNAIERLQKQQEIEEKEIYNQRQALLRELEAVRNRENELTHQMEAFEKACKVHEKNVQSMEELLNWRELAVKTREDAYDQKLNNELRKYQLELKDDYAKRTKKLSDDEERNKEEMLRLQKETAVLNSKAEDYTRTASELKDVQAELESAQAEVGILTQQNAVLRGRLEDMGDYAILRRECKELHAHVHMLKEQLQEQQRLLREPCAPSQEVLVLQAEVRRLEMVHRLHQEELQKQQQMFHVQLTQEAERCVQLKTQLLDCEERTRCMAVHTEEIKQQLRHTQQALENEVFRNHKPSMVDHSILDPSADKVVPPDLYVQGALLQNRLSYDEGVGDPGLGSRGQRSLWPHSGSPDPSMERVAKALARVRELEKEAEYLEEDYRTYQQRAVRASGVPSPTHATGPYIRPTVPVPHRVTSPLNEPGMHSLYMGRELTQAPQPNNRITPRAGSPPPRRLSSTPVSASKVRPREYVGADRHPGSLDGARAIVTFVSLSPGRVVSPIAAATVDSSEDYQHITPPSSPQMRSPSQRPCRPQEVSTSSQESSPKPEKICIQDLTEHLPDLHCSSKQLQDPQRIEDFTPCSRSEQDSPLCLPQEENTVTPSSKTTEKGEEDEEDEEKRWQEERKRKKERRLREREEAQEHEKKEFERLEKEQLQQEAPCEQGVEQVEEVQCDEHPMKDGGGTAGADVLKDSFPAGQDPIVDPLHKYMMMVMQGRERDKEQSPKKEENGSPEPVMLSEDQDNSTVAFSPEDADEFW